MTNERKAVMPKPAPPRRTEMARNQAIITTDTGERFESYGTVIAVTDDGRITLDKEHWDHSRTTLKYLIRFLRLGEGGRRIIESRINDGSYTLADLN